MIKLTDYYSEKPLLISLAGIKHIRSAYRGAMIQFFDGSDYLVKEKLPEIESIVHAYQTLSRR